MSLTQLAADLWTVEHDQTLPGRFHMPTRMTVVRLRDHALWLHAPTPIDDALADELAALGEVHYLVAPNRLHHLYLPRAQTRYREAGTAVAPGLPEKLRDLRYHLVLGEAAPAEWGDALKSCVIAGAPNMGEVVFLHRPSATLIVTDLVFNLTRPRGAVAAIALRLMGVHGRLAQSRAWRFATQDRLAAAASCHRILHWSFDRLVCCHGDVVETGARPALERALSWMIGGTEPAPPVGELAARS